MKERLLAVFLSGALSLASFSSAFRCNTPCYERLKNISNGNVLATFLFFPAVITWPALAVTIPQAAIVGNNAELIRAAYMHKRGQSSHWPDTSAPPPQAVR